MQVQIKAISAVDVSHLAIEGRFFPVGQFKTVEVLDQEPAPLVTEIPGPIPGTKRERRLADPDRVSRKSYEIIKHDGRFSVIEAGGVDATLTEAQIGAARQEVARLATENSDLKVKIAELESLLAQATKPADEGAESGGKKKGAQKAA
ncbi:MAG TPA: hypothetical protein VHG72_21905 [Polyangia bacterium]|nr:hypothetical protein [Polyangia bacterium]